MERHPIPQPVPALEGDEEGLAHCARCRVAFEDEPVDTHGQARRDWSLCSPCHAIVFPGRTRSTAILTVVPQPEADQPRSDDR